MGHEQWDALAEAVQRLEFESTFMIVDGRVVEVDDMAPECYHDETSDIWTWEGWHGAVTGMTGQYAYRGDVMHPSEFINCCVAERLAEGHDPGTVFALVTVEVLDCEDCEQDGPDDDSCPGGHEPAGWTILARAS